MPTVLVDQYWSNAPRMQFTVDGGTPYVMKHNPTVYNNTAATSAEIEIPAAVGIAAIIGGVEYAPVNIGLQWDEMDSSEYAYLSTIQLLPVTMIDMEDNGYYGYLKLGAFDYTLGAAEKVGQCKALFMAIAPADGNTTTIKRLNDPQISDINTTNISGGAIGATTDLTIQYAISYWTNWGETNICSFSQTVNGNTPAPQKAIQISWPSHSSMYYRKARIYIATSNAAPISPGDTAYVLGDVFWAQTNQWTDYCGNVNGALLNKVITPTQSTAYIGTWGGGRWNNKT